MCSNGPWLVHVGGLRVMHPQLMDHLNIHEQHTVPSYPMGQWVDYQGEIAFSSDSKHAKYVNSHQSFFQRQRILRQVMQASHVDCSSDNLQGSQKQIRQLTAH